MKHFIWFLMLVLTACGASDMSAIATSIPASTAVATITALPSSTPTARPPVTVVSQPTARPDVTAVPLLESITVMYIEKGWNSISPMIANLQLQEIGEASADMPFEQQIPFNVEGITLLATTKFSGDKLSDGGMICVLYSRSDLTQWVIPVAVELEKQELPGTFRVFANVQDKRNVIARSAIPSDLQVVVFR